MPPFRLQPALPVGAYQSFTIAVPLATHWRPATCAETDCPHWLGGWQVRVEGLPPELVHTARNSGRRFTEMSVAEGETWLVFEAGQPCFKATEHRIRTMRPERFIERAGDWRGNPGGRVREHVRPDDWVDSFATNQIDLKEIIERG